jgi:hypothetical protein
MDQVSIKYTIIFHCKTLQILAKFGFLVWKQTIWQPCLQRPVHTGEFSEDLPTVPEKHCGHFSFGAGRHNKKIGEKHLKMILSFAFPYVCATWMLPEKSLIKIDKRMKLQHDSFNHQAWMFF